MSNAVAESVQAFLRSGKSVCPFAEVSVVHWTSYPFERRATIRAVHGFARSLGASPPHALVTLLPTSVRESFEATKHAATEVFLDLYALFGLASRGSYVELRAYAERVVRPMLNGDPEKRPLLGLMNEPLFAICMAPVYPQGHPRHAPEPIVVVTWGRDVADAQAMPAVLASIQAKAQTAYGGPYDADELMLPLPKNGRYR